MPTELEELVGFLHHDNPQIRLLAIENLVGYSQSAPHIFKKDKGRPISDLKRLVKDHPKISSHALTILTNLSSDKDILEKLIDDVFLEILLSKITDQKESSADLIAMLFSNLAKSDSIKRLFNLTLKTTPSKGLSDSKKAIDRLIDCFVRGVEKRWNTNATFDYLAYLFADLSKFHEGRKYFVTSQSYDDVIPLNKLVVFTESGSDVRRRGVAYTLKNISFDIPSHPLLLDPNKVNILPYLLLPLAGPEDLSDEDILPDLQLLPPSKTRDPDPSIMTAHLETLLLLSTTRPSREVMRQAGVYHVIKMCHLNVEDDGVREGCERLVQVLMRDEEEEITSKEREEEGGGKDGNGGDGKGEIEEDEDEDEKIIEIV